MTEIEKMRAGIAYNSEDEEIKYLHLKGKRLMWEFNQLAPDDIPAQRHILFQMLGAFGERVRINQPFWIDYGWNIYLGEDSFINMNCTLLDANKIIIGDRTLLAPDVKIYTALHPKNGLERYTESGTLITMTKQVTIGSDSWIGGGSIILPGVKIGNNVTIGAGSVVTHDIPDNTIAYGNPCRVIGSQEVGFLRNI